MQNYQWIVVMFLTAAIVSGGCQPIPNRQTAIDHYVRGRLLAEEGDVDAALQELSLAVRNDPNLSIAHAAVGDIHRKRGNWEFARRSYDNACRANPYAFKPHYNLGLTYQTLARAAQAAQRVQRYLKQATQVYLRAIAIEQDDFDANLNLSVCYFQLHKFDLAEQYCKRAIELDGEDPNAYSNLGIIYDSQNRLYDAIRAYKQSLEIDTHQPKLLMNLGSTYMRQNRLHQAIRAYDLAAAEAPDDPSPWEQIGSCHYRLGENDQALDAYQKAISFGGGTAMAHRGLGVVYMTQYVMDRTKNDLRDKALACWHVSLELKPDQQDLRRLVQKYTPQHDRPEL